MIEHLSSIPGQIIFSILSLLPPTKKMFQEALLEFVACFAHKGILTSAIGAFVLGVGLTLCGAVGVLSKKVIFLDFDTIFRT